MQAGLYGIIHSNRDFNDKKHWGKNEFTTEFPMAVAMYQIDQGKLPVYIKANRDKKIYHENTTINKAFGFSYNLTAEDLFFDFESVASLDKKMNGKGSGNSTRSDVVIRSVTDNKDYGMEIKLTAVPDNTTYLLPEAKQSSEIVIRPVSILHLSNILAEIFEKQKDGMEKLSEILLPVTNKFNNKSNWLDMDMIEENIDLFIDAFDDIYDATLSHQKPVLMQCIWRTQGKSFMLSTHAFDTFFWSSHAFALLFRKDIKRSNVIQKRKQGRTLERKTRSLVWVIRMLCSFLSWKKIAGEDLIHELSYGNQTDKAFAASGKKTYPFLKSAELTHPRIRKDELNKIILGNGIEYLSPERRLDMALSIQGILNKREDNS